MFFRNVRFITKGVELKVSPLLQVAIWECIDNTSPAVDRLQVFEILKEEDQIKVIHTQEEPEYRKEYLLFADAPFYVGKIYVINTGGYTVMLLPEEY